MLQPDNLPQSARLPASQPMDHFTTPGSSSEEALLTSVRSENGLGQHYLDPNHPAVRIVVQAAIAAGARNALDFACGRGLTSIALTNEAGLESVVATDINPAGLAELAARAAQRGLPVSTQVFDAANSPLPNDWRSSFDMVVAKDLYPFLGPEENARFLRNSADALRSGGTLVFTAPSVESRLFREGIDTHDPFYKRLTDDAKAFVQTSLDHFSFASEEKLDSMLAEAGLSLVSVSYYGRESGWMTAVAVKR